MKRSIVYCYIAFLSITTVGFAFADHFTAGLPYFFPSQNVRLSPDLSKFDYINFLTTTDFPPFNYLNQNGELVGYHIDLAKEICKKLNMENKCRIEIVLWEDLVSRARLDKNSAILSGLIPTLESRQFLSFTPYYLRFPGRFIVQKKDIQSFNEMGLKPFLNKNSVGVVANTKHQKLLESYFPDQKLNVFSNEEELTNAIYSEKIRIAFGDGFLFSRWLLTKNGQFCCQFIGGNYIAPHLLNPGLAISVSNDNIALLDVLSDALQSLEKEGRLKEIYLRYFPIDFYSTPLSH